MILRMVAGLDVRAHHIGQDLLGAALVNGSVSEHSIADSRFYCMRSERQRQRGVRLVDNFPERSRVNLGALQAVGIINVDGLPLREEINRGDGCFAVAVSGLLGSPKGQMGFSADRGGIDVYDAGVEIASGMKGLVDVARVDRSGKTIDDAIGDIESLLEAVSREHRNNRAENFFLSDAHPGTAIPKHGRLEKPAARASAGVQAMSAGQQLGALLLADLDVAHHLLELRLVDRRPHFRGGVQPIADLQLLGARHEAVEELAVDFIVYGDAARGRATLAGGAEPAPDGAVHREIQVGIVHHDDDVLAAHLQTAVLEHRRTAYRDLPAYFR